MSTSYLAYAVKGFFDNGGRRCYIGRIVSAEAGLARGTIKSAADGKASELQVAAVGQGAWSNNIRIMVRHATQYVPPAEKIKARKAAIDGEIKTAEESLKAAEKDLDKKQRELESEKDDTKIPDKQTAANEAQKSVDDSQSSLNGKLAEKAFLDSLPEKAKPGLAHLVRIMVAYWRDSVPPVNFMDPGEIMNPERREPDILEDFDNLTHDEKASNNFVNVVNGQSRLVRLFWKGTPGALTEESIVKEGQQKAAGAWKPLSGLGGTTGGTPVSDGKDLTKPDYVGSLEPILKVASSDEEPLGRGWGLNAMRTVDEVAILAVPDDIRDSNLTQTLRDEVVNQCELLKDRFAILSVTQTEQDDQQLRPYRDTSYAGFYHPWIWIFDPLSNGPMRMPATGHIAGVYARSDIERGVHKAPANEVLRGALSLCRVVTKGQQDILNPRHVNCIRDFRADGRGIRLWGARTMSSDPEWKYVNVRRLFIFVEESIDEGTQWVVFEPNSESTWMAVRRNVTAFLSTVWRNGALMGTTPEEAFFVRCDRTTMTEDDINNGRLICLIGIAPVKPAEFVIFRISQKTLEAQA